MPRRFLLAVAAAAALLGPVPARADGPLVFFTLSPCRVVDTRVGFGGVLTNGTTRAFTVQGVCGVPTGARAAVLNLTAVDPTGQGHLRVFPSNLSLPNASTVNFGGNDSVVSNEAVVPLAVAPNDLAAFTFLLAGTGSLHLVIDVTGYFADLPVGPIN